MERIETALQKAKEQHLSNLVPQQPMSPIARIGRESVWADLPSLAIDPRLAAKNRIVTFNQSDPAHVAFDMMRTRTLQKLRDNNWTSVAITSPTVGCGKSVVSLNLAFSLANQKECRTLVVDLDLRRPQVGKMLGLKNPPLMESFLRGQGDVEDVFIRYGDNIAIASNSRPVRFASELLQAQSTARVLKEMKQKLRPDVIIYDMPPMLATDDVMAFLSNVDGAVLVVAAETTTQREADICERDLAEKTNVLGVVLNKCRFTPDKYGY